MAVAIYRRGGSVVDIQEEDGDMDLMTEHTTDTSGPLHTYSTFGSTQEHGHQVEGDLNHTARNL